MQSATKMKKGIAVAGSIIVDKINVINKYPKSGELTQIQEVKESVGGCVPNVAIDIKTICPELTVKAVGLVGKDDDGILVKKVLNGAKVDSSMIKEINDRTSFTQVISERGGQRTFFTYAGASSKFGIEHIDFENLNVKMLHLGYFLLLDKIDKGEGQEILKKAKEKGIITSIDLVSENSKRYSLVLPCLKYTDNLIINEIEASKLTNLELTKFTLQDLAKRLKELGVKDRVIIHTPEKSVCLSDRGYQESLSFSLPNGFIKGTTGAGDAFCSGALIGIYNNESDKEILDFASTCAVCSLTEQDATSGVRTKNQTIDFCKNFKRKELC